MEYGTVWDHRGSPVRAGGHCDDLARFSARPSLARYVGEGIRRASVLPIPDPTYFLGSGRLGVLWPLHHVVIATAPIFRYRVLARKHNALATYQVASGS